MSAYLKSASDVSLIKKAFFFAEKAHKNSKRCSGEPYFIHPFQTACYLAKLGMDAETISAGLLHDTIEDAGISSKTIEKEFGKNICLLVEGVTKFKAEEYKEKLDCRSLSLQRLFTASSEDMRVMIIKLIDRLHNAQTLSYLPEKRRIKVALETLDIYAPIADLLGMNIVKRKLEDLAFASAYPAEYERTKEIIGLYLKENEKMAYELAGNIRKILLAESLKKFRIEIRIKNIYSAFLKLEKREWNVDSIYDFIAIRIILKNTTDCYQALGAIHKRLSHMPGRIKDYFAFPKQNGYQSLHTTVFTGTGKNLELHIRTEDSHRNATFGIISEFSSKKLDIDEDFFGDKLNFGDLKRFFLEKFSLFRPRKDANKDYFFKKRKLEYEKIPKWIKNLAGAELSKKSYDQFIEEIKTNFLNCKISVFTVNGDMIKLPADSTPIDFAYAMHSDIGNHISKVLINNKKVPIDTNLQNGDIVEITTEQSRKPLKSWLNCVKTAIAKRHIRDFLGI